MKVQAKQQQCDSSLTEPTGLYPSQWESGVSKGVHKICGYLCEKEAGEGRKTPKQGRSLQIDHFLIN
ncbi:hypothetical protein GCM10007392_35760 [Saccharospirillum salsuginis]|uniref:Uncharacterized protein n=1 Tax=Saccharospirillum salsuginis TaxID=418750 RepID=A0A918NG07_9GAMM|nr:hypothetical protein GCM10007392_35760 [Saccharospirillum salsuginis]